MKRYFLAALALILLTISTMAAAWDRHPLGLVGKVRSINGNPYGIDVKGNIVYLAEFTEGSNNFQTYDISNPKAPVRIAATETGEQMDELIVRGNRAYVANDALGLSIFDVSNPRKPTLLGQRSDGAYANSVAMANLSSCPMCVFVSYHYWGQLKIYDVRNPASIPEPIGSNIPNAIHAFDVAVAGKRAYLVAYNDDDNDTIKVLSLENLSAGPVQLGELVLSMYTYGDRGHLAVSGRYLYFAASAFLRMSPPTPGGLRVVDIGDPTKPKLVGRLDIADIGQAPWKGVGIAVVKHGHRTFAYMVGKTALHIIDVSRPTRPTEIASYALPAEFGPMEGGFVVVRDGMAYVAATRGDLPSDGHGGLAIYRVAKKGGLPCHHVEHRSGH